MEAPKRTIGYVRPKVQAIEPAAPVTPRTHIKTSDRVLEWIGEHPLFKVKAMCLQAGIDPGNFHRTVKGRKDIPFETLQKIIPIIKNYGYAE